MSQIKQNVGLDGASKASSLPNVDKPKQPMHDAAIEVEQWDRILTMQLTIFLKDAKRENGGSNWLWFTQKLYEAAWYPGPTPQNPSIEKF